MANTRNREIYLNRFKDPIKRQRRAAELELSDIKVEKMHTRLKVYFDDLGLEQSLDALGYMCEKHYNTLRKNGELYIVDILALYNGIEDINDQEELIRLLDDKKYLQGLR